jgi:N-alpha-acetyltransferase 50
MPQASLTAWLKKPSTPSTGDAAIKCHLESPPGHLPTPPTSSPSPVADEQDAPQTSEGPDAAQADITDALLPKAPTSATAVLPPQVEFRKCTKEDIPHLKRLNGLLLQIPYPESFYRDIIEDPLTNSITLLAVWHDNPADKGKAKGRLVGAIRGRLLAHAPTPQHTRVQNETKSQVRKDGPILYLSTLVLLSPYRSHGIATHLLATLTKRAVEAHGITSVGAHVWEANDEGLEWYQKRGFREVHREAEYYRRLKPGGAVVMQRDVSVMDFLGG